MADLVEKRVTARLGVADVAEAARLLRAGGTVAIPTETVYGLGANALDAAAVENIFVAKERPYWDPLIVHVSDSTMLAQVVQEVPELAKKLMEAFWPGPLTLLMERNEAIGDVVTAGRPLVGVRMPAHPVALQVISAAGVPIAAPSANRFGHVSPTRAEHVLADLDGRIDAVLDAGLCAVGVESTVLDVTQSPMVMYRPGAVTVADIERVAGPVAVYRTVVDGTPESLPSPGVGIRHYAPKARVVTVRNTVELRSFAGDFADRRTGVLLPEGWPVDFQAAEVVPWASIDDTEELARRLFDGLRELDARGVDVILVPLPGEGPLSAAIADRLAKATMKGRE